MNRTHKVVDIVTDPTQVDALIAWLCTVGFQAFEETQNGVKAYIAKDDFDESALQQALAFLAADEYELKMQDIEARNWNEEWEASWENVEIDDFCQIIPSFRSPRSGFTYSITVDPKMAFGTGHHETTRSMIRLIKGLELEAKELLDMGCGTGILGILASKKGAKKVWAIDIDPWSVENTAQNLKLNEVENIEVSEGVAKDIPERSFDFIFANINKNVLLEDIPIYARHLKKDGQLLLSGFYTRDEEEITILSEQSGLKFSRRFVENDWVAASYIK
ncbi:MAG: 50S ribosomal protein L11 methyltransferase [Bacteroidota bacterium]